MGCIHSSCLRNELQPSPAAAYWVSNCKKHDDLDQQVTCSDTKIIDSQLDRRSRSPSSTSHANSVSPKVPHKVVHTPSSQRLNKPKKGLALPHIKHVFELLPKHSSERQIMEKAVNSARDDDELMDMYRDALVLPGPVELMWSPDAPRSISDRAEFVSLVRRVVEGRLVASQPAIASAEGSTTTNSKGSCSRITVPHTMSSSHMSNSADPSVGYSDDRPLPKNASCELEPCDSRSGSATTPKHGVNSFLSREDSQQSLKDSCGSSHLSQKLSFQRLVREITVVENVDSQGSSNSQGGSISGETKAALERVVLIPAEGGSLLLDNVADFITPKAAAPRKSPKNLKVQDDPHMLLVASGATKGMPLPPSPLVAQRGTQQPASFEDGATSNCHPLAIPEEDS